MVNTCITLLDNQKDGTFTNIEIFTNIEVLANIKVLVVIWEEGDLKEDTIGQRTLKDIKTYNIMSAIYNFATAWKDVKITALSNSCKKLMLDEDYDLDFAGFEPNDFHQSLLHAGKRSQCQIC